MSAEGIKQLSRSCWSVRVQRLDERTGNMRNRKARVHGSRADAIAKRDQLRAELAGGVRAARLRLAEYARAWLDRRAIKPSTRDRYEQALRHIVPVLGSIFVDVLTPGDVAGYMLIRLGAAAGNTALNELRLLRTIARDSLAEGLAQRYWCDRVRAPSGRKYSDERPNLLTPEQAHRVLGHVPAEWAPMLFFALTSGARIGEVTALHHEDLDREHELARLRFTNYKGALQEVKTEASKRWVPFLSVVAARIPARSSGLVFPARGGGMHRGSPLRAVLARACAAAGVPRITTHGLRRSFNNQGRQLDPTHLVVRATTGHTDEAMTERYSHIAGDEKVALARAIAAQMGVLVVSSTPSPNEGKPA